jgi:hypothetical protein
MMNDYVDGTEPTLKDYLQDVINSKRSLELHKTANSVIEKRLKGELVRSTKTLARELDNKYEAEALIQASYDQTYNFPKWINDRSVAESTLAAMDDLGDFESIDEDEE